MKKINIIGMKFNRWTVIDNALSHTTPNGTIKQMVLCKCECEEIRIVNKQDVINGKSKSCGCYNAEASKQRATTHGLRNTKYWYILNDMRQRCNNPNKPDYQWYGRKGVRVCQEWSGKMGLANFYNWLIDNNYKDGLTVDRIDGSGNYEPSNCRLITMQKQQRNKINNINLNGRLALDIAKENGVKTSTFYSRIHRGWKIEDAVV